MIKTIKLLAILVLALTLTACGEKVEIKESHGFMVLDIEQQESFSTIVAVVEDFDLTHGSVVATNIYDKDDIVYLEAGDAVGVDMGDVILITFEHDSVVDVKKNKLRIGDYVKGQKVSPIPSEEGASY